MNIFFNWHNIDYGEQALNLDKIISKTEKVLDLYSLRFPSSCPRQDSYWPIKCEEKSVCVCVCARACLGNEVLLWRSLFSDMLWMHKSYEPTSVIWKPGDKVEHKVENKRRRKEPETIYYNIADPLNQQNLERPYV